MATETTETQLTKKQFTYPKNYRPVPINGQIAELQSVFGLDGRSAFDFVEDLPEKPVYGETYMAIPSVPALYEKFFGADKVFPETRYSKVVKLVIDEFISQKYNFSLVDPKMIHENSLRVTDHTKSMFVKVREKQDGEILIIGAQLGEKWKNHSVEVVRESYDENEFGLGLFAMLCHAIVNPSRFIGENKLEIDCAGDKVFSKKSGEFSEAPRLYYPLQLSRTRAVKRKSANSMTAGSWPITDSYEWFGSATGFVL